MQQLLKFLKIDADKLESLVRDMSRESRLWTKVLEAWERKIGQGFPIVSAPNLKL